MPDIRYLKIAYAVACAYWMVRLTIMLYSIPAAGRNPNPMAAVYCLLVVGAIPALAGYFLFFNLIPRIGRAVRQT